MNMQKINVLFLAEELRIGGAETYFYSLENNIDRKKYNFYSMAVDGSEKRKLSHPEKYYEYTFSFLDRYKKAKAVCKEKKIEIIHVNSLRLAFVAALLKKTENIKVIYTKHNETVLEKFCPRLYAMFLNKSIDKVNVICEAERNALEKAGVKRQLLTVVYNGIAIDDFPFTPEKKNINHFNIGILARVDKVKNHRIFLQIAENLHVLRPETKFYIGGDGPDKSEIEKIISEKNMKSYVYMEGFVNASDFLSRMDIIMLISQREVFPMSIIEAMSAGVTVVSKNLGGISELVNDSTGYLIEGENVSDYVNVLIKSMDSDETEKKRNARKRVEELFTIKKMVTDIEAMYQR